MKKQNYKKIAKNVIELEIQALKKLKNSINSSFNQAVDLITKCQAKNYFMRRWKKWSYCVQDSCNTIFCR